MGWYGFFHGFVSCVLSRCKFSFISLLAVRFFVVNCAISLLTFLWNMSQFVFLVSRKSLLNLWLFWASSLFLYGCDLSQLLDQLYLCCSMLGNLVLDVAVFHRGISLTTVCILMVYGWRWDLLLYNLVCFYILYKSGYGK